MTMNLSAVPLFSNEVLQLHYVKAPVSSGSKWKLSPEYNVSVFFHVSGPKAFLFDGKGMSTTPFISKRNSNLSTGNTDKTCLVWGASGKVEFLEVRMTPDHFKSILASCTNSNEAFPDQLKKPLLQPSEIQEIIYGISRTAARPENLKSIIYHAKAMELLAVFLENALNKNDDVQVTPRNRNLALLARQHIDQIEGRKDFTIIELARQLDTNETTLKKSFKSTYGKTIFSYYMEKNMQKAFKALKSGNSVTETSSACGYSNIAHFSIAFKREFGMNPSA
ncbi:MAG: helix-turn-helix transcriptional regulator, partial [Chitinophagaceae bacterium]|nr:helix-turn-helix transcriptional regulator [Chitinophagaceae bacterium]